jgi:hypothetical protein
MWPSQGIRIGLAQSAPKANQVASSKAARVTGSPSVILSPELPVGVFEAFGRPRAREP